MKKIIDFLFGKRNANYSPIAPIQPIRHIQQSPCSDDIIFTVNGAGYVAIGSNAHNRCGQAIGFGFGVSWGQHGYVGGVIGREQAKRLAAHIIQACEGITESELDEFFRIDKDRKDKEGYFNKPE